MNYIEKAHIVINRAKNYKILKYFDYLENGVYYFSGFWGKNGKKFNREREITDIQNPKTLGIVYSKNKKFEGTEFYLREDGLSIRFFDKKRKKMLTIFEEKEYFEKYIEKSKKIDRLYLQSKISKIDYKKLFLEEEYLEHKEIEIKILYSKILKELRVSYRKLDNIEWLNCEENFSEMHKHLNPYLSEKINLDKVSIPKIFCHGDLHFGNIINTEKNLYFIDWDRSRECVFIYDILFCIFGDYLDESDEITDLHIEYFKGSFDEEISKNFEYFGVMYEPSLKFFYFYLLTLEVLKFVKLWNKNSEKEIRSYGEKIMKMEDLFKETRK